MNNIFEMIKLILSSRLKSWILSLIHPKGILFENNIEKWIKKTQKDPDFCIYDSTRYQLITNPKLLKGLIGIGCKPKNNSPTDSLVFIFPGNTETPFHYRKLMRIIANHNQVEVISYFNPGVAGTPGEFINELQIRNLHLKAIHQHIDAYIKKYNKKPRLFFYGYSLGGAIALLIAKDLITHDSIKPKVFIHASFESTSSVASQWAPYQFILGVTLLLTTLLLSIIISYLFMIPLGVITFGILIYTPTGIKFTQSLIKKVCNSVLRYYKMDMNITKIAEDLLKDDLIVISHPKGDQTVPEHSSLINKLDPKHPTIHHLKAIKKYNNINPHSLDLHQLECSESKQSGLSLFHEFIQKSREKNNK
jgi:hypothetical protein